jgi:hypothetical protein
MKSVDNYVSPDHSLTVMIAYTQLDKPPKDQQRQIREAERALRDICENKAYKKVAMECIKVNLFKVPLIAEEYHVKKEVESLFILLFKKGRLVAKIPVPLNEQVDRDFIYRTIKEGIEEHLGEFIDQKLDELNELEADIARARAAAPQYIVDPYYNSLLDYAYHGYYNSYHRPYPYRRYGPGFGFGFSMYR